MGGVADDTHLGALMRRVQAGDADAYEVLLEGLVPRMRGFVRCQPGFVGSEDVDDLVHFSAIFMVCVLSAVGRSC
jgi:hypothetical protein